MKKEQVLELMDAIPHDLIEEADVQAPAKRRMPKIARTGLIAACLCLALIGTAAAVHYSNVRIVDGDNGVTYLKGGIAYYPYDSLSDAIKALDGLREVKSGRLVKGFASWQAAEDFIGVNLMDNPVLDTSLATHYSHIFEGIMGDYLIVTDPGLSSISVYGCYEIGEANILVQAELFTDHHAAPSEDWDERFLGYDFNHIEGTQVVQDTYTAPNGLDIQILEITRPDKDGPSYKATLSLNGIPIVISVDSGDARAALIQILDGFEIQTP